jgi:hypothetical protein
VNDKVKQIEAVISQKNLNDINCITTTSSHTAGVVYVTHQKMKLSVRAPGAALILSSSALASMSPALAAACKSF